MKDSATSQPLSEKEVFFEALEQPTPQKRAAFLQSACGTNSVRRARLEALLADHFQPDRFMEEPAVVPSTLSVTALLSADSRPLLPSRYKLLDKIGEGGCGIVYEAEQSEPLRRRVALKVIRAGMDTRSVIARFEAERQALALMDHPNIAKVLDAGATENGRPYFVMELVPGEPITRYCERQALPLEERLRLFIQVCHAVEHAHQKGIIHRDLKPSNVLVADQDGAPVPKIIDFGVAKAIQGRLTENTVVTELTQLIGTPAYMSPEQALLTSEDIDTRSDIYSLGILLYELLAGTPPFTNQELLTAGLDEMRRTIREVEPPRPSVRLQQHGAALPPGTADPSAEKDIPPTRLRSHRLKEALPQIRGDLDWIVMKCLEKTRQRRYDTASALAADLQRHLNGEPVAARPPSATYRLQKHVRRHRAASLAVAAVTLAVILGSAFTLRALLRERAARINEQAALKQAQDRMHAALAYVDQVLTNVAPRIRLLAGAAEAQTSLLEAGVSFMQRLRETAGTDPAARLAVARLLIYTSISQNPGEPNTSGDYEVALQRAREALGLLSAEMPQLSEEDRLDLIRQGMFAIVQCLYGLGRWEEGVAYSKQMEPLLDQLERFPARARWVDKERMLSRANAGWANFAASRPQEALDEVLPLLRSEWARQLTDNSGWEELHIVMNAHDTAGNVYGLLLNDYSAMLPHAAESLRLGEVLMRRFPENVHLVYLTAQNRAWHGYALLCTGRADTGLAALGQARAEIEARAANESSSDAFRRNRMIITALQALAFAAWSEETSAPLAERQQRLASAEACLAQAEEFSREVKSNTRSLPAAREEVARVRSALNALQPP